MQEQEIECRGCGVVYLSGDRLNIEAIEDWGHCLRCEKIEGEKYLAVTAQPALA